MVRHSAGCRSMSVHAVPHNLSQVPAIAPSRRQIRRVNKRALIVEIATRQFLEHGYCGATMTAIASELGGSKGTLWSYFTSKEDLFNAVVKSEAERFRGRIRLDVGSCASLHNTLVSLASSLMSGMHSSRYIRLQRIYIAEVKSLPPAPQHLYEEVIGTLIRQVSVILASGTPENQVRDTALIDAATHFVAMIHYPYLAGLMGQPVRRSEREMQRYAEACAITLLQGINGHHEAEVRSANALQRNDASPQRH